MVGWKVNSDLPGVSSVFREGITSALLGIAVGHEGWGSGHSRRIGGKKENAQRDWGKGRTVGGSCWATTMTTEETSLPILPTPGHRGMRRAVWREGPGMVKRVSLEKGGRFFWEF